MPSLISRSIATRAHTYEDFLRVKHFACLDGFRAVAVLMVMGWHARNGALSAANGNFGVTLFFVLSGFLITTLAVREEMRSGAFQFIPFTIRRFFRIFPLLWLGVAAYAVLIFVLHLDPRASEYARAIPFYLLYMGEWPIFTAPAQGMAGLGPAPFDGVWSLGIEEKFYIVWPILAFVILARRRGRGLLALTFAVSLWLFWQFADLSISIWVIHYAPIFLGCAAALFLHTRAGYAIIRHVTKPCVLYPVALSLVVLIFFRLPPWGEAVKQLLVIGSLLGVVLEERGGISSFLSWAPLRRIGVISYGLYLFHALVFKLVDKFLPPGNSVLLGLLTLAVGGTAAVLVCEVLHRFYERPLQDLGRRIAKRFSASRDPAHRVPAMRPGPA